MSRTALSAVAGPTWTGPYGDSGGPTRLRAQSYASWPMFYGRSERIVKTSLTARDRPDIRTNKCALKGSDMLIKANRIRSAIDPRRATLAVGGLQTAF